MVMMSLYIESILPELEGPPKVQTLDSGRRRWGNGPPDMFQRPPWAGEAKCIELHTTKYNFVLIASRPA